VTAVSVLPSLPVLPDNTELDQLHAPILHLTRFNISTILETWKH
jgi:hypothetical protein